MSIIQDFIDKWKKGGIPTDFTPRPVPYTQYASRLMSHGDAVTRPLHHVYVQTWTGAERSNRRPELQKEDFRFAIRCSQEDIDRVIDELNLDGYHLDND